MYCGNICTSEMSYSWHIRRYNNLYLRIENVQLCQTTTTVTSAQNHVFSSDMPSTHNSLSVRYPTACI